MTDLKAPVHRRTINKHSRYGRRVIVSLLPGDVVGFRLERDRRESFVLPVEDLYNQAELRAACAKTGFDASPRPLRR